MRWADLASAAVRVLGGLLRVVLAAPAWAAATVAMAPLRGKGGAACTEALEVVLRAKRPVIEWNEAGQGLEARTYEGLLEVLRSRKGSVGAEVVILGTAAPTKVILEAYDVARGTLLGLTKLPTGTAKGCRLSPRGEARLLEWVEGLIPASGGSSPPVPSPPPPPPPAGPGDDPPPPPVLTSTISAPPPPPGPSREVTPPPASPTNLPLDLEAELGIESRTLGFREPRTAELRAFSGTFMVLGLGISVAPLQAVEVLRPLVFSGQMRRAVFVDAARPEGGAASPVRHLALELLAAYPIALPAASIRLVPTLSFPHYQLGLGAPQDANLPGVRYNSLAAGFGLNIPITEQANLSAEGRYLLVLGQGPIGTGAYLGEGSTKGVLVQVELGLLVLPRLTVETGVRLLAYDSSFDGEGARPASGAGDTSITLRVGVRWAF